MSLRLLIVLLVILFAILALLAKLSIDPWWGVLALALVLAVWDYIPSGSAIRR